MKAFFSKRQLKLCYVPVPEGYPQSQTHVGVFPVEKRLLMTTSPYPNYKRPLWFVYFMAVIRKITCGHYGNLIRSEYYENPCIYVSSDGVSFKLLQSRPLMECPDAYYGLPAFNSDPDLFVENNMIYILNRSIFRTKLTPDRKRDEYKIRIYLIEGILDDGRFKYISTRLFKETSELIVSPCLIKYQGEFLFVALWSNCYNDGESFEGLKYIKSSSIDGLYANEKWNAIKVNTDKWIPWHMSLFRHDGRLYSIVACVERGKPHRCWQMLGEFSKDLTEMRLYNIPLTDYRSYRGSAYVTKQGDFKLYTPTVHEAIKGGNSVDGREVLLAHYNFEKLLNELRNYTI